MLTACVIIGVFILLVFVLPYAVQLSQRSAAKGSTSAGGLGVFDEIFHPAAHRSRIVIEQLKERKSEAPTPGGDDDPDGQKQ